MKRIIIILLVLSSVVGCKQYEEIQFLGLKEVKVNGIKNGNLQISAKAAFNNPNDFKGKLKSATIYALYQGDTLANVSNVDKVSVGPNTDFNVPLSLEVSMSKLQKGLLSNLASLIRKRSVEIEFTGNIKVSCFGFTQTIPVNYKEDIQF